MTPGRRSARRLAVIGAGWAGLAAAVEACTRGWQVSVFEMAHRPGGRARSLGPEQHALDNGQHILIGAYRDTLALMRRVGVDPERVLLRTPLALVGPNGHGLRLPRGPALWAFATGVLRWQALRPAERWRLLAMAARWQWNGFRCDPGLTVAQLAEGAPASVYSALLDPLCVAALNTPARDASAQVLLTVLREALFGGSGAADLLLPRRSLSALLPEPAQAWLQAQGAHWHAGHRVGTITGQAGAWSVDGQPFEAVVLAASATESARLLRPHAPEAAATAAAFAYQPIVTAWIHDPVVRWTDPMLSFAPTRADQPGQFGFDLGALGGQPQVYAVVVSGAGDWVAAGLDATGQACLRQWRDLFGPDSRPQLQALRAERRATFACTPGLQRPPTLPCPGLALAGDHVAGPFPATLEGAVRSGLAAIQALQPPVR